MYHDTFLGRRPGMMKITSGGIPGGFPGLPIGLYHPEKLF